MFTVNHLLFMTTYVHGMKVTELQDLPDKEKKLDYNSNSF